MKKIQFTTFLILASLIFSPIIQTQSIVKAETIQKETQTISKDYGKFPLIFEQNKGQTDNAVKFISRGKGYSLYLTQNEAVFALKVENKELETANESRQAKQRKQSFISDNLQMKFAEANLNPIIEGLDEAVTKTNYYIGQQKFENLSNYYKVNYKNLYNGIDAVFYGNQGQIEYDFNVSPNADANQIKLNFDGAKDILINNDGNLVIKTENTELIQPKPVAYQIIDGQKREIGCRWLIEGQTANNKRQVKFEVGEYDKSQVLTIDPVLNYLTYIGGSAFDNIFEVAADAQGNAFISGSTSSLNFHGESRNSNDKQGVFVAKINPQGTGFVYLTILEGNGDDTGRGIAVDAAGNSYVTGIASHFFPTTSGAYDTIHGVANSSDAFSAKLNVSGGLVYSTFLGGTDLDEGFDIAVDSGGKAYVVGGTYSNVAFPTKNKYQSCGFPLTPGGTFDSQDAFLTVLNADGSDIAYSSCIGNTLGIVGVSDETAFGVALDSSNNAYVTGVTNSNSFKVKNAFQPNIGGGKDGWAAKFNPSLSGDASVVYATFLGGSGTDIGEAIAVNAAGQAHIVGLTGSVDFPLLNAFRSTNQINEGFVTVLSASGTTLVNSSFLGGADQDEIANIALDGAGSIYVTGNTLSNNFPTALPFQPTRAGVRDSFVTKLKFGRGVISSSYLGGNGNDFGNGIAVKGNFIYAGGKTASNNLATTSGVISPVGGGNGDAFIAKILDTRLDSIGIFRPSSTFQITQSTANIVSQTLPFTANLAGEKGVSGDFDGDGIDTTGTFSNGIWKLRNSNFPILLQNTVITSAFGQAGDLPIVGDWNGDGKDTLGVFRPSTQQFLLSNVLVNPAAVDITINFGLNGDLPIAGDWNGDGIDTVAAFRPSSGQTFFTNQNVAAPSIDFTANLGIAEDLPIGGDWNGDGKDSLGLRRASTNEFFLSDDNVNLRPVFLFGQNGDQPIAGDWDGIPNP